MSAIGGPGGRARNLAGLGGPDTTDVTPPAPAAPSLVSPTMRGEATLEAVLRGERTLANGSRGPAVKKLQEALRLAGGGAGAAAIAADGAFGPKTAAAVRAFQTAAGLPATGLVDAPMLLALDRKLMGIDIRPTAPPAPRPPAPPAPPRPPAPAPAPRPPAPAARPPAPAPRPPAPAPPPAPSPYDTGWFTDADSLPVPADVRRYLDQALRTGRHSDIRALRMIDWGMASAGERARLVEHLLAGPREGGDEEWMLQMLQRKPAEGARVIDALAARGRLAALVARFDGSERTRLLRQLPAFADGPATAASIVGALGTSDTRENRLAAHWVFDRARAGGYLDDTIARLRRSHPTNAVVKDLIGQANPTIRPLIVGHRGLPTRHPENTLPSIRAALDAGADAVEIDITVTKDDRVVLWHDHEPGGVVASIREAGLEGGMGFKPHVPPAGHPARRPVHELNLVSLRENYGYSARDGDILTNDRVDAQIPTIEEVARLARERPELKKIVLDVKLPADRPDVQRRFARELKRGLEANGLVDRVTLMHTDAGVVRNLKRELGDRYAITHDVEIVSLAPSAGDYSAVRSAERLGNRVASVGRPRIGIGGYDTYLDVLRRDRARLDATGSGTDLLAWTINDELEMREIMAIGVDGILTDDPALLARVVRAYRL